MIEDLNYMKKNPQPTHKPQLLYSKFEEAEADALLSSIGQAIIATDSLGHISRINQAALEMIGFKEDEILGQKFINLVQAIDPQGKPIPSTQRPITRAFTKKMTINEKLYYKIEDRLLPVSVTVSPIIYQDRPVGVIQLFSDITEDVEADKMKSDFISLASHQLRTPLSAINMYSHILFSGLRGPLTPEQKSLMKVILSSVNQMNELINTLLNIACIETGSMKVAVKPFSPNELINDILNDLHSQVQYKSIKINQNLPDTKQQIISDPTLMREVYTNLISNAIKYSRRGSIVTIRQSLSKKYSLLKISDQGIGIPLSAHPYIFTKFYRAVNASSKSPEGTGLGLYIVKQIAGLLGGTVWFESKAGYGSDFYVRIPREHPSYKERARILA